MVKVTYKDYGPDDPIYQNSNWIISPIHGIKRPSQPAEQPAPAPQEPSQPTGQDQPQFQPVYAPAMSEEAAHAELRRRGATQEQLDLDISQLDRSDFVDPKYLPAIAAEMMQKGRMPTPQQVSKALDRVAQKMRQEDQSPGQPHTSTDQDRPHSTPSHK